MDGIHVELILIPFNNSNFHFSPNYLLLINLFLSKDLTQKQVIMNQTSVQNSVQILKHS